MAKQVVTQGASVPVIYWHSDPVRPDETLVLSGEGFDAQAVVELARFEDGPAGEPQAGVPAKPGNWVPVAPLQRGEHSLKAVIPADWTQGLYACRVRSGERVSKTVLVNAPDVWWFQGDCGLSAGAAGGWLRILGKCLNFGGTSQAMLKPAAGAAVPLNAKDASCYSLAFDLPADLAAGEYALLVHNGLGGSAGWTHAGTLRVEATPAERSAVVNVLSYGADPEGKKDSTMAFVQGLERLAAIGGGVLFVPAGRYRIDSVLRSGMFIATPLRIARNVTLRGAGQGLTSLWWPDRKEPLPTLIETQGDVTIEDIGIYTQGRHRNIISNEGDNVRIQRVRIRANCYYMTMEGGKSHHRRGVDEGALKMGTAIEVWGNNIHITDCDIYASNDIFQLRHVRGGYVARNTLRGMHLHSISGGRGVIYENNDFEGNSLSTWGASVALHYGASTCRNLYYAHNRIAHVYGGDHEAMTFDGHGTAYFGKSLSATGTGLELDRDIVLGWGERDSMSDTYDTVLFILAGRGAGQYREVKSVDGRKVRVDRPWDVEPDATSVLSIGGFNGRHLFIGNTMQDTGTVIQLYPPNCECIVAENRAIHASNINSLGKLGLNLRSPFNRVEPSWYNQFLDNHVVMGNGWGGGTTEIDRWLGGEGFLNIWGWNVAFAVDEFGADQDVQLTEEHLVKLLGESPTPGKSMALSAFQIVRRHRVDNNSSIRIRGAVADAVIEHCDLRDSARGIRIDNEVVQTPAEDLGQLTFEPDPPMPQPGEKPPFLSPSHVLVRRNTFTNVTTPYQGTALAHALVDAAIG